MCQNRFLRFLIACLLILPAISQAQKSAFPHIILIIADDLNWDDIGPYGNRYVKTPHLLMGHGYYTALAGKWHEGPNTRGELPGASREAQKINHSGPF